VILSNGFESNSTTILFTGSIYSPSISKTTTYYVRTSTGPDFSVRVPVVASVYSAPPLVSLFCLRMPSYVKAPLIFTANGGADLLNFQLMGL
jgi:hypothetical protein